MTRLSESGGYGGRVTRFLLTAALLLAPSALAQTAAELLTASAISSTLDSTLSIHLPSGSSFVKNPKYAAGLAPRLLGPDAARFTDFQLYTARGLATRLADNYIGDLKTSFATSGFFESGSHGVAVGTDTWTRTDFQDDAGKTLALFVAKKADGVYFLTARGK